MVDCTCHRKNCPRHGNCCECIEHHRKLGSLVSCMKDLVKKGK